MREIKFRAWDKEEKEYYYNAEHTYDFFCSSRGCYAESFGEVLDQPDRFIVEQYTGLKDKNGKEIYEGDIVKHQKVMSSNQNLFGTTECNGVVEWDDENTGYYPFNNYERLWDLRHLAKEIEVIGNIHENPELGEE